MLHLRHALPGSSLGWWSSRFSCGLWLLQCRGLVALIRWGPWFLGERWGTWGMQGTTKPQQEVRYFFLKDGDVPFPLGKLRWKPWMKVHCFVSCVLFANVGWSQIAVTPKLCPEFWLGLQFSSKNQPSVRTGGFWKLSVNRTENPAWKWARLPTGEPPKNDIMTSTHRNPFLFHHESFLKKNSVSEFARNQARDLPRTVYTWPLASLWWWGDCPLADRGVVTCSSASIWKRSGFHLSTCRSFVSNASGLRCDTDFFLGGMGWDFRWI